MKYHMVFMVIASLALSACATKGKEPVNTGLADGQIQSVAVDFDAQSQEGISLADSWDDPSDSEYSDEYLFSDDVDSALEAPAIESTDVRVIYFAYNDDTITPASYAALKAHAKHMQQSSQASLRLEGHADERGTREFNLALSERRANAVLKYLRILGVSSSRLRVVAYGEEKPVDYANNESAWKQNRRVELVYTAGEPL